MSIRAINPPEDPDPKSPPEQEPLSPEPYVDPPLDPGPEAPPEHAPPPPEIDDPPSEVPPVIGIDATSVADAS